MQEFELTFYFKRESCRFSVPRDFWCNTLLMFLFEDEYYTHPAVLPLPGVDRVPGHKWEHNCLSSQDLKDIKYSYNIQYSGTHSHATFPQGNFVFAGYPIPVTAMSRSIFRTNAHSNMNVELRSRHEKIIPRVHISCLHVAGRQNCRGCYAPRSSVGERPLGAQPRRTSWLCIHLKNLATRRDENVCPLTSVLY